MRSVVIGSFVTGLGLLAALGACTVNSTTNNVTPDGGVITPTGDGGTVGTDAAACNKAPPTGAVTLVAPQPAGSTNDYGQETALALDKNGYPLIAFSTSGDAGQVFFMSWGACAGSWKAPAVVDTVGGGTQGGEVSNGNPLRQVAIASDPTSGTIAIVYVKQIPDASNAISATWIAKSTDGGTTWTKEQLSVHPTDEGGDIHGTASPNIAFASGKLWVAYTQDYTWCNGAFKDPGDGTKRCEGWVLSGDSGNWARQIFQRGSDGPVMRSQIGMATDSAGNLGIAFISEPEAAYNRVVSFWRPNGTSTPVTVFDSNNEQNDSPTVSLVFDGTKPRIAAQMVRDASADNYNGLFAKSDDGVTWTPFTTIPKDVSRDTVWYQAMTVDSKGTLSVLAYDNGGTDATPTCGDPQVMRSTDGTVWTPFCVETTMQDGIAGGSFIAAKVGADDKLQLVFENDSTTGQPGAGVVYWHE